VKSFKQFFTESHAIAPIRDIDMWDDAVLDWWGYIERSTEALDQPFAKHITRLSPPRLKVQGPDQILQFWKTNKMKLKKHETRGIEIGAPYGPTNVIMTIQRLGGYPDTSYVIQDIGLELVQQWWKDWLEDNEGRYV
jgi:hypothetical protein